jgi:hypothetical protein
MKSLILVLICSTDIVLIDAAFQRKGSPERATEGMFFQGKIKPVLISIYESLSYFPL